MTTKFGDFLPPKFNAVGDKYPERFMATERDQGLAFMAPTARKGKNNDACFDKMKRLWEGEPFVDPARMKLLAKLAKKAGAVSDNPFKPVAPMKRSACPGDFKGTLGGTVPYVPGHLDSKLMKGDVVNEKPNLYTNPGKKGSYGTVRTTLSEARQRGGQHGEYTYIADPYIKSDAKAAGGDGAPFVPANPAKRGGFGYVKTTIGNKAHGVVDEFSYKPHGVHPPDKAVHFPVPFVPPRVPKIGYNRTLEKFPAHIADPDQWRLDAKRRELKHKAELIGARDPWHPSNVPKIGATRSVMRMNV